MFRFNIYVALTLFDIKLVHKILIFHIVYHVVPVLKFYFIFMNMHANVP